MAPRHVRFPFARTTDTSSDGGAMTVAVRDEWEISCRDLAGRRRAVTVFASDDHVVLVAPPGEAAVLAPLDVGRLRAALRDAVVRVAETSEGV